MPTQQLLDLKLDYPFLRSENALHGVDPTFWVDDARDDGAPEDVKYPTTVALLALALGQEEPDLSDETRYFHGASGLIWVRAGTDLDTDS